MKGLAKLEQHEIPDEFIDKCELCFEEIIWVKAIDRHGKETAYPCEKYRVSLIDTIDRKIKIGYRSHYDVCVGYNSEDDFKI